MNWRTRRPAIHGRASAFDIFVGLEVKYHENLKGRAEAVRPRQRELADEMGCFVDDLVDRVSDPPTVQIWRDNLLAGSLVIADDYDDGLFVFLSPRDNAHCSRAVEEYRSLLTDDSTFADWSLEEVVDVVGDYTSESWIETFSDRYLDFGCIDEVLGGG